MSSSSGVSEVIQLQDFKPGNRESQDEEDFVLVGESEKETTPKRVICNILEERRSNIPAWRSYLRRVPEGVVRRLGTPSEKPILRLTTNVCALALNAASEFQSLKTDKKNDKMIKHDKDEGFSQGNWTCSCDFEDDWPLIRKAFLSFSSFYFRMNPS